MVFLIQKLSWELSQINWTPIFLQLQQASYPVNTAAKYCILFSPGQFCWTLCYHLDLGWNNPIYLQKLFCKIQSFLKRDYPSSHAKLNWMHLSNLNFQDCQHHIFLFYFCHECTQCQVCSLSTWIDNRLFPPQKVIIKRTEQNPLESAMEASSHRAQLEV